MKKPLRVLRSLWIIAVFVALVVTVSFAWWAHREKTRALQLSADAANLRVQAEKGDAKAQFELARMYDVGKEVGQNYPQAIVWYTKAAEQGYAKAQFNLGNMYFRGQGVGKDYAEALKWIQRAADQGNDRAESALGFMYYNGQAVRQDYAEAARWYRRAAEHGEVNAEHGLAYMSYNGQGVPQDYPEAARWYRKAAEQGDADAQQGLAYMYYNGQGVPQDSAEAARWYRKAAEQGEVIAQEALGYMYATGRGVPMKRSEAVAWYRKAANQGDAKAKRDLESLDGRGLMGMVSVELLSALIGFPVGLWLFLGSLLGERKLRSGRRAAIAVLGLVFLADAGLSLYAFRGGTAFWLRKDAFDTARWLLNAVAVVIVITVVLRPKSTRRPRQLQGRY